MWALSVVRSYINAGAAAEVDRVVMQLNGSLAPRCCSGCFMPRGLKKLEDARFQYINYWRGIIWKGFLWDSNLMVNSAKNLGDFILKKEWILQINCIVKVKSDVSIFSCETVRNKGKVWKKPTTRASISWAPSQLQHHRKRIVNWKFRNIIFLEGV